MADAAEAEQPSEFATYDYEHAQQQLPAVVQPAAAAPAQPSVPEGAQQGGDAATAAYYAQYYQQYYQQFYTQEVTEAKLPATMDEHVASAPVYKAPSSYQYEKRGTWEKLFDGTSGHIYYRNTVTLTSQWKMPPEWNGEAPVDKKAPEQVTKIFMPEVQMEAYQKILLKRPARKQIAPDDKHKIQMRPEGALEYNVWYHKWFGGAWQGRDNAPALTRCVMDRDCGFTKADILDPDGKTTFFCHHFARGCCNLGAECSFLHRIPTELDVPRIDNLKDCFGRDRHRQHRDDMGGVGAFDQDCRSLYVGGLSLFENIEDILWREFGEWGTPEARLRSHINVIRRLNIGFVRFHNRLNAEFAKVAMADQLLAGACQINVRWAYEDPNPNSQTARLMEQRAKMLEAAVKHGFLDEHGEEAGPKRLQTAADSEYTGFYPNTDAQFAAGGSGPKTAAQLAYEQQYQQQQFQQQQQQEEQAANMDRFDQLLNKVGQ